MIFSDYDEMLNAWIKRNRVEQSDADSLKNIIHKMQKESHKQGFDKGWEEATQLD